jgi:hypothetical protein
MRHGRRVTTSGLTVGTQAHTMPTLTSMHDQIAISRLSSRREISGVRGEGYQSMENDEMLMVPMD